MLHVAPGAFRTEGIYSYGFYSKNTLSTHDDMRKAALNRFANHFGFEKGDPVKAMEVIVDIVRGEGVAKGRSWPGLLVLGGDADSDVRNLCNRRLKVLDEWKDVAENLNFDDA